MSHKSEQNTSIKDYLLGSDNQHNKTKTKLTEHTNNKPATITKTTTMNKEGSASSKVKTPKLNKSDKSMIDEPTGKPSQHPTQKRDASTRSPLDGNPEKRNKKIIEGPSLTKHIMMNQMIQMIQSQMKIQHARPSPQKRQLLMLMGKTPYNENLIVNATKKPILC